MEKKCIAVLVLAAALASQLARTFTTGSTSSSGSDGGGSINSSNSSNNKGTTNSKSNTTVSMSSTGVKTTGTTTNASPTGGTVGVAVDIAMTTRQQVATNSKGEAVIGDTAVAFADSAVATAGLPSDAVSAVNSINTGKPLNEAVQGVNLIGYNALAGTHAIITKDAATGAVKAGTVGVSLYMPNLVSNINDVQALFYDNVTGQWQPIPATRVDPVTETIAVNIPESDILSVVYKN